MLKIKNILLAGAVLVSATACDGLLDINPRQTLTPTQALADIKGYEGVVAGAYGTILGFGYYGQTANIAPEALADNMIIANNTGRYVGEVVNAVGAHINYWGNYGAINSCNIVIKGVDGVVTTNPTDEALKGRFKGEAYFLRALMYHDLHKVYSYEPGKEVNGFNKGVILRTTPTEQKSDADFRERSTNEEGYALMEADLLAAIQLLPEESTAGIGAPYRATKAAARALLSRVYLYWGKYAQAAQYADAALGSSAKTLTTTANYIASWSASPHPESIFELEIRSTNWSTVDGVNNSMASVTNKKNPAGQFAVGGSPELISSFEAGDIRKDVWVNDGAGRFQCMKWPGEKGDYLENIPVIRVAEVVLIAAEGKARSGNEAGARTDLNRLRAARGLEATTASGSALLDLILNERRAELAGEGHRFFDLKRLGRDIPKPASAPEPVIPYSNFRILSIIPIDQVLLNDKLEQNPGYGQ